MSYVFSPNFQEYTMYNMIYLFGKFHLEITDNEFDYLSPALKGFFTKSEDIQQQSQGSATTELAQGSASDSVSQPISD